MRACVCVWVCGCVGVYVLVCLASDAAAVGGITLGAQVALYGLLLRDDMPMPRPPLTSSGVGFLLYLNAEGVFFESVAAPWAELRGMLIARNQLAVAAHGLSCGDPRAMPPLLLSPVLCGKCFAQASCLVYHAAVEGGDRDSSGVPDAFDARCGGLSRAEKAYFAAWDRMITLECSGGGGGGGRGAASRRMWTESAEAREAAGQCLAGLLFEGGAVRADGAIVLRLRRPPAPAAASPAPASLGGRRHPGASHAAFAVGDYAVLSFSAGPYGVASGVVEAIDGGAVRLVCRRASPSVLVLIGARERDMEDLAPAPGALRRTLQLDKDESATQGKRMRGNLEALFGSDGGAPGASVAAERWRRLAVALEAPVFVDRPLPWEAAGADASPALAAARDRYADLHPEQQAAVRAVWRAEDYVAILGMPGSGKTTTMAVAIAMLVATGKSVLVTSYTHNAVDTILLKARAAARARCRAAA